MKKHILPTILSIIFIVLTVLVSIHYYPIEKIDQIVFDKVSTTQNPLSTAVFKILTDIGNPLSAMVIGGIMIILLFLKKRKSDIVMVAVAMIVDLGIVELIKNLIERVRPASSIIEKTGWSFPSGHASFAGLITILIFSLFITHFNPSKRTMYGILLTLIAIGVAYSRIYLGVHWTSDVMAGSLLGISIALFAINTLKRETVSVTQTPIK